MIAVPASGGASTFLLTQKEEYKTLTKERQRFWKRILIVDDEKDITLALKVGIQDSNAYTNRKIEVYTSNNPVIALSEF
jgi:hypothetical protein